MRSLLLAGLVSACTLAAQPAPGAGSIAGHVFNALTSAPIRRATVILTAPQIWLTAHTDSEGRFEFTALPPGTYRLFASRLGFLDHPARRHIRLGPNDQITDAEIRLPPQSVIAGRILDENGELVERARVSILKQIYRDGRRQWVRLNVAPETNDGEYRVPGLKPGRYLVEASDRRPAVDNRYGDPPKTFNILTYYPNAPSQQQAVPVEVGVAAEVRGVDIRLVKLSRPPSVYVRGKVTGMPGNSQTRVWVNLLPDASDFGGGNNVAEPPDYAFEVRVPPGEYTILGAPDSLDPDAYGTGRLTVAGDVAGIVLAMNAAPRIGGRISLAESGGQAKLQGVRVSLNDFPYHHSFQEVRSDATGKLVFEKAFSPGHYRLNVQSIPDGCFLRDVKLGGEEVSPDDIELLASAQLELVLSCRAGAIAGSVSDAGGRLFQNSTVTLIPPDNRSQPMKQTADNDGKFRFTNLRPGTYKLFAWEEVDDDVWQDPEFCKRYEGRAAEITVGLSKTQDAQLRVIAVEEMK